MCMTAAQIEAFFHRLAVANPTPESALVFYSPYTLLVAVVLSARATDRSVNNATRHLFAVANTPAMMLALGESNLKTYIRAVGLFHNKAKHIIAISRLLLDSYNETVPGERALLEKLPGVGRKSANVVLNLAFGQPVIAVDTHVFRICNRSGLARGRTALEVESKLTDRVPETYRLHAHHWLVMHGRSVCQARKAHCVRCMVCDLCFFVGHENSMARPKRSRDFSP